MKDRVAPPTRWAYQDSQGRTITREAYHALQEQRRKRTEAEAAAAGAREAQAQEARQRVAAQEAAVRQAAADAEAAARADRPRRTMIGAVFADVTDPELLLVKRACLADRSCSWQGALEARRAAEQSQAARASARIVSNWRGMARDSL